MRACAPGEGRCRQSWRISGWSRQHLRIGSARSFIALPAQGTTWAELNGIEREHHRLLDEFDERHSDLRRLIHEALRNRVALGEHLKYIAALRSRDPQLVESACRAHLRTARATLLRSIDLAPHREMQAPGAANGAMA